MPDIVTYCSAGLGKFLELFCFLNLSYIVRMLGGEGYIRGG